MTRTRIVLAAGAVSGILGLSLGAASLASAQTTPTTPTTKPATTAPTPKGNCPDRGTRGTGSASTSGSGV
jgi:hypothetical protein